MESINWPTGNPRGSPTVEWQKANCRSRYQENGRRTSPAGRDREVSTSSPHPTTPSRKIGLPLLIVVYSASATCVHAIGDGSAFRYRSNVAFEPRDRNNLLFTTRQSPLTM